MTITTSDIQLFQILKLKMGEREAEALVTFVDNKIKENNEANLKVLATREDIANLRTELKVEMKEMKAEMIKWMFIFWVGQLAATFGLIMVYLKK